MYTGIYHNVASEMGVMVKMPRWEVLREPELLYDHRKNGHVWFYFKCGAENSMSNKLPRGRNHHWHERMCMHPQCGAMETLRHHCTIKHRTMLFKAKIKSKDWVKISLETYSPTWYNKWKDSKYCRFKEWEQSATVR